jgi:hypothetical protein
MLHFMTNQWFPYWRSAGLFVLTSCGGMGRGRNYAFSGPSHLESCVLRLVLVGIACCHLYFLMYA